MDGVFDEDVYETVPSFGDFIQQTPLEGAISHGQRNNLASFQMVSSSREFVEAGR